MIYVIRTSLLTLYSLSCWPVIIAFVCRVDLLKKYKGNSAVKIAVLPFILQRIFQMGTYVHYTGTFFFSLQLYCIR